MRKALASALSIAFTLGTSPSWAGAWTLDQGQYQLITTLSQYQTDEFTDKSGNSRAQPDYEKWEARARLETGLTQDLTLGLETSAQHLSQDSATGDDENHGIGDTAIFARYTLWQSASATWSVQPGLTTSRLYQDDASPRIGSHALNPEIHTLAGYSFSLFGQQHYIDAAIGYRFRTDDASDQIRAELTLGLRPTDKWLILPQIFTVQSVGGIDNRLGSLSSDADYDLTTAQLSVVYSLTDALSVQAGVYQAVEARNTGEGAGWLAALWWRF